MAIVSSLAVGLISAILAAGTKVGTSVAGNVQTGKLAAKSEEQARQLRADQLFSNMMQRQQAERNLDLSRENFAFQKNESQLNRVAMAKQKKEEKRQQNINRALGLFQGQTQLKTNISNLWSNIGGGL